MIVYYTLRTLSPGSQERMTFPRNPEEGNYHTILLPSCLVLAALNMRIYLSRNCLQILLNNHLWYFSRSISISLSNPDHIRQTSNVQYTPQHLLTLKSLMTANYTEIILPIKLQSSGTSPSRDCKILPDGNLPSLQTQTKRFFSLPHHSLPFGSQKLLGSDFD